MMTKWPISSVLGQSPQLCHRRRDDLARGFPAQTQALSAGRYTCRTSIMREAHSHARSHTAVSLYGLSDRGHMQLRDVRTQAEAAAQRRDIVALLLTLEGGGTSLCSPSSEYVS